MYTFEACKYDVNGTTQALKFPTYNLCSGAKYTGTCRNLAQLLLTPEAVPNFLFAEMPLKVYPFPNPVKDATPKWAYYFVYTANQVMKGTVFGAVSACNATITVKSCANASGDDADVVTLTLPRNTGDGTFVGLNLTTGATVYYLTTGHNKGILLNPYKSFEVKYSKTTGAPEIPDCESLRFYNADFTIDGISHSPCPSNTAAKITWNGLAVEAARYGTSDTLKCNAKILKFDLTGSIDHSHKTEVPVEWVLTDDTQTDPCHATGDALKRAKIEGSAWVPNAPVYTADEIWIHLAGNEFSHIGPSTTTATYHPVEGLSLSGTTLHLTPKFLESDAKGHKSGESGGSVGDDLTVDLASLKPATTTVEVVIPPITATCNGDGTITINYSTKTITVIDTGA